MSVEDHLGPYGGYDPSVNPSVANVFATAAFRFGHATVPPLIRRLNESFQEHQLYPSLELHHSFFSPWRLVKEGGGHRDTSIKPSSVPTPPPFPSTGGMEPLLRGVIGTAAPTPSADMLLSDEVTDRLVVLNIPRHMDLAALNLQRGRDHALPGRCSDTDGDID